jgi:hypothetical protein
MRRRILALAAMTLILPACTAGFRAGGERGGVGAGASVGPPPPVYVAPGDSPAVPR